MENPAHFPGNHIETSHISRSRSSGCGYSSTDDKSIFINNPERSGCYIEVAHRMIDIESRIQAHFSIYAESCHGFAGGGIHGIKIWPRCIEDPFVIPVFPIHHSPALVIPGFFVLERIEFP